MKRNLPGALPVLPILASLAVSSALVAASDSLFNYQGRLDAGDQNAQGPYAFRFRLVDGEGQTVGPSIDAQEVLVEDGRFSVDLDFGSGVFDGKVRELEIAVRPSSSTEAFAVLQPRQRIVRVPQASHADHATALIGGLLPEQLPPATARLDRDQTFTRPPVFHPPSGPPFLVGSTETVALLSADRIDGFSSEDFWRLAGNADTTAGTHFLGTTDDEPLVLKVNQRQGLRLQPDVPVTCMEATADAVSPSLAGGYEGNLIVAGKAGSVISGGGAADHPCLGANLPNVIAANFASIGGGLGNRVDGDTSAIGGGYANVIEHSANYCIIAGGGANRISSGGVVASAADGSTISGGSRNEIRDDSNASTIGGGGHNLITSNVDDATIGGGVSNVVSAFGATIPGGIAAGARLYGQWAYAAGAFAQPGDAQMSCYVLRGASTNTQSSELFLDGRSARLRVPKGGAWAFEALVIGRNPAGPSAGYRISGVIENDPAGGTAFIGVPTTAAIGEDLAAWTVEALASDADDTLRLRVQGAGGLTRWVASVRTAEIIF